MFLRYQGYVGRAFGEREIREIQGNSGITKMTGENQILGVGDALMGEGFVF